MNNKNCFRILTTLVLATVAIAFRSEAEVLSPIGLAAGSPYILVFTTHNQYPAISGDIGVYNADVNAEAETSAALLALNTTWTVIGSTADTNVIGNIGSNPGIPIYNTAGQLVALDDTTAVGGLFAGVLSNPLYFDENGTENPALVWTGSYANGATSSSPLGAVNVQDGNSEELNGFWINNGMAPSVDYTFSLYAISGVIDATPEPTTGAMIAIGGAIMLLVIRRKGRTRPTA